MRQLTPATQGDALETIDIKELDAYLNEAPLDFNGGDFSEIGVELGYSHETEDQDAYGFHIEDLSLDDWLYSD